MNDRSWLSNSWLVSIGSVAAVVILVVLLWEPWNRRGIAAGKTLQFFCAAGATRPVAEVVKDYQRDYAVTVQTSYGGTGELLSQIKNRAGDLYLAADTDSMRLAQQHNLIAEAIPVAVLRPVIVVHKQKQVELKARGAAIASIKDLLRDDLKVVVANQTASVGKAARRVLTPSGIWDNLKERERLPGAKVSEVGTVMEVARIVSTRPEYVGIVWSANAGQFSDLETVSTPEFESFKDHMWIAVLAKSSDPTAALQFARFLTSKDKGLTHFANHHFEPAGGADVWAERPKILFAAGAMLKPGLDDAVKSFAAREGIDIDTQYAGCGQLVAGMKAIKSGSTPGRFPDAYFACDISFLDDVAQWFERPHNVTRNDVVIIVAPGNPRKIGSLQDVAKLAGSDARIGLAHETKSALGKLTADLAKQKGVYQALYAAHPPDNVVYADAAHTLVNQMAGAGSLDAAVVYRSNVLSTRENAKKVDMIEIPEGRALATQPFAIAKESQHKQLLGRFFDALVADESSARFKNAGFEWVYGGRQ